jgi:hypothetical protein
LRVSRRPSWPQRAPSTHLIVVFTDESPCSPHPPCRVSIITQQGCPARRFGVAGVTREAFKQGLHVFHSLTKLGSCIVTRSSYAISFAVVKFHAHIDEPSVHFRFSSSRHAIASSAESCPAAPLFWMSRPSHLPVNHFRLGLLGLPLACGNNRAVSITSGCRIFSAKRSFSSE